MKKVLFALLFFAVVANSITQSSILGNWSMVSAKPVKSTVASLESDTLSLTDDWKYAEIANYKIDYPGYGPNKVDLTYKLRISSKGDYRIEGSGIRKYIGKETFEMEILDPSDEDVAKSSLKEIEKLIKEEASKAFTIMSSTETELELQGTNNSVTLSKPRKLPNSKLTAKQVPFFAPDGWRYPESTKELSDYPVRLKNDKNLLTIVEADFNGDGHKDAVAYLINDANGQTALFLKLSKPDGSFSIEPYGSADRNTTLENGVFLAPAGEYTNISNKQKFKTEHDGFLIVIFGTAATLVHFDTKSNDWLSVPIGKKF